jgi:hypothetical protein
VSRGRKLLSAVALLAVQQRKSFTTETQRAQSDTRTSIAENPDSSEISFSFIVSLCVSACSVASVASHEDYFGIGVSVP